MTATVSAPAHESRWRPDWPIDVRRIMSRDRRGTGDPTLRYAEDGVWRTTTTRTARRPYG